MTFGRDRWTAPRVGVRRELMVFYGAAALALLVVGLGAVIASRSVARSQALTDAERQTSRMANLVVGPLLYTAMDGDADGYRELARAIDLRMRDGYLRQVTVWDRNGTIIFADDPVEVGRVFAPSEEIIAAIDHGETTAQFADSPEVTTRSAEELRDGFVEVYTPFSAPAGASMAFEAYYDYARVDETANSLLWQLIPLVLVPLVVLMAIQIPIATSMAKRVRRHDTERSELAERGLAASERERVRIAADLHDGPIQELAGMGYALGAVAQSVPDHHQALMNRLQETIHRSIESLRQLMVDLYPPDLSVSQLPQSLSTLAAPLRNKGIDVEFSFGRLPAMNSDVVTTLYRVAHEALANVAEHSEASAVTMKLMSSRLPSPDAESASPATGAPAATSSGPIEFVAPGMGGANIALIAVERDDFFDMAGRTADHRTFIRLQILDNGVGIDPDRLNRRSEGHLGLRLLTSRVEHLGGILRVSRRPHGGTSVEAIVPADGFSIT